MLIVSFTFGLTGCERGGGTTGPMVPVAADTTAIRGNVSVRLRLPDASLDPSGFGSIRSSGVAPTVTFKASLVQYGNTTQPLITLQYTVAVDASGTANCHFTGIPLGTLIGEVSIANGRIGTYTSFQGALDVVEGPNTLWLAPSGTLLEEAVLATVLKRIIGDPGIFARVDSTLLVRVRQILSESGSGSSSVCDDIINQLSSQPGLVLSASEPVLPYQVVTLNGYGVFPKLATYTGEIGGAEVTVRWQGGKFVFMVPQLSPGGQTLILEVDGLPFNVPMTIGDPAMIAAATTPTTVVASFTAQVDLALTGLVPGAPDTIALKGGLQKLQDAIQKWKTDFLALSPADQAAIEAFIQGNRALFNSLASSKTSSIRKSSLGTEIEAEIANLDSHVNLLSRDTAIIAAGLLAFGIGMKLLFSPSTLVAGIGLGLVVIGLMVVRNRQAHLVWLIEHTLYVVERIASRWIGIDEVNPSIRLNSASAADFRFVSNQDKTLTWKGEFTTITGSTADLPGGLVARTKAEIARCREVGADLFRIVEELGLDLGDPSETATTESGSPAVKTLTIPGKWLSMVEGSISNPAVKLDSFSTNGNQVTLKFSTAEATEQTFTFSLKLTIPEISIDEQIFTATVSPLKLAAPTNVKATGGANKVDLTWAAVEGATGYQVWWQTTAGVATETAQKTTVTGTSHTVTGLTNETTYYFVVTTLGKNNADSEKSVEVPAKPTEARFTKDADGIITDSQENLQWYCGYSSAGYTWYQTDAWAKGLTVGSGGWTLATRDQLKGLRGAGYNSRLFTVSYSWSSELKDPNTSTTGDNSTAWGIDINRDTGYWGYRSNRYSSVLAVRSRR